MTAAPKRTRGRPRDEGRHEARHEAILVAAARLFARHGYAGLDLQVLADEIGIGKGTIYRYFASKREADEFLGQCERENRVADLETFAT